METDVISLMNLNFFNIDLSDEDKHHIVITSCYRKYKNVQAIC